MKARIGYGLLIGVLLVAALPSLLYPFTRDQGAYAYIADLIMDGGVPYRDAWDVKPPLIYFIFVLAFRLFGRSELALRLFEALYVLLTAGLVGLLAWEVFRQRTIALASGWLYAFCYCLFVHFYAVANPETFLVPLLVLLAYGLVGARSETRPAYPLVAGLAAGWSVWFKPTALVVVVFVAAWWVWDSRRHGMDGRTMVRQATWFVGGGVLGVLPVGIYLLTHGWTDFVEVWGAYIGGAYLKAPGLAGDRGWAGQWGVLVRYLNDWRSLVGLTGVGLVAVLRARGGDRKIGAILALMGGCLASVALQGKLFEYHWIPALAPVAIVGAAGLLWMRTWRKVWAVAVVAALVLGIGYDHVVDYRRLAGLITGRIDRARYDAHFTIGKDFSRNGSASAAEYLRLHTDEHETVLLWGAEPLVNFLARRRSPTQFVFSYMLIGAGIDARQQSWRNRFLDQVQSGRPRYVVLVENDLNPLTPAGSMAQLVEFTEFRAWLDAEYAFETQVEDYLLYRLRS